MEAFLCTEDLCRHFGGVTATDCVCINIEENGLRSIIGPTTMSALAGAGVLMMVLLGGMGSLWGPRVGAAIFIYIQDYISTMTEHWEIYLGLVVILLVLFMPTGFVGLGAYFRRLRRE